MAAGLMAILTLSVFAQAQFTGPESALRVYHVGVIGGDLDTVKSVSLQDPAGGSAQQLQAQIKWFLSQGAMVRFGQVQRRGRDAVVEVSYIFSQRGQIVLPFYLRKSRNNWKVDADATWGPISRARF